MTDIGAVIAIDGPAGSGKSTISRMVAERVGLPMLDTGAMYRAVTCAVLRSGGDVGDPDVAAAAAEGAVIVVDDVVTIDGADVTTEIRGPEVSANVSIVAAHPGVRTHLRAMQREWMARHGGGVLEGRDIGTVVLPRADIKFFLDASVEERARRRWKELRAKGRSELRSAIEAAIRERDHRDRTRAVSPLRAADDAVVLDTTRDSRARVKRMLLDWVCRKTGVC